MSSSVASRDQRGSACRDADWLCRLAEPQLPRHLLHWRGFWLSWRNNLAVGI